MKDEWTQATAKLIEQTRNARIRWQAVPQPIQRRNLEIIGVPFSAEVGKRKIAIYEFRKITKDHPFDTLIHSFGDTSNVQIEFVDENLNPVWVWPSSEGRWQLLEEARYSAADAQQFLEEFLASPS